ncbi:MAG: hypothetical protein F6K23_33055 [Okeania sp. SIO2C9]|uniref:CsgG/HfaB family protein n=1 Tax=Okeania sp. SIO2C9 TaxID=2607791 RepID=UPI0013BF9513|nr:CsgG/HfaB family protein [Okeania sp. SIO2C9]NEQ77420.1 hypothetical protein [Okeania sp. SIO2C9]
MTKQNDTESLAWIGGVVLVAIPVIAVIAYNTFFSVKPPYPPRTKYGTPEEVIITPPSINSVKRSNSKGAILNKDTKVAVFRFETPEGTQGGTLVSDMLASLLQKNNFEVVERENIERILREQNLIDEEMTDLENLDVAKRLGKLVAVDYMIFGAVTLYKSEPQTIYLPIRIKDEDREEYENDYNKYRQYYIDNIYNILSFWVSKKQKLKKLRVEKEVLSIEELETEISKLSIREFRVVASVGISAKLVDVKTGQITWLGQGETNDFTTVAATRRILEEFLKSIQK